jgi:hypothetical protein
MATDVKFDVELRDGHRPLADDEPVFVFRAQDKAILRHREAALRWQAQNGCSVPD